MVPKGGGGGKAKAVLGSSGRHGMVQSPLIMSLSPLVPAEGWHVLHQIYELRMPRASKEFGPILEETVAEIRVLPDTQLLVYSVVGRGDLGIMLVTPDLHQVDRIEKKIWALLQPLQPLRAYSFLSLTEESEYKTTDEEYAKSLVEEKKLDAGSPAFEAEMKAFQDRMAKYRHERVYPKLGGWNLLCFYPMLKRRSPGQNWYGLSYEERRRLMGGHARVGRTYAGKVKQLITGATGLSDWEWGVTLFANDLMQIKSIVYEMRFDEVSHTYGEFGPFYTGIILEPGELSARLSGQG